MKDYLKFINSLSACVGCGVITGKCLCNTEDRIEDSYICDCEENYGGRCKYPEKYRTASCDGKEN